MCLHQIAFGLSQIALVFDIQSVDSGVPSGPPYDYNNTYYHLVGLHILRKNPAFTGVAIISRELHSTLDERQKEILLECDINVLFR